MRYSECDEIYLDAESLAEGSFKEIFERTVLHLLNTHLRFDRKSQKLLVDETESVSIDGRTYKFRDRDYYDGCHGTWANAAFALFDIVNRQLEKANTGVRFYAVWGGNSLGGIFLTPQEAEHIRDEWMQMKADPSVAYVPFPWPHLSTYERPWCSPK